MKLRRWVLMLFVAMLSLAIVQTTSWAQEDGPSTTAEVSVPGTETPPAAELEVPATSAETIEAPAKAVEKPWFGDVQLWEVLAGIVALIWGVVKARIKLAEDWERKLLTFVESGVQKTYDEFVKTAKAQAADHKLTQEQISTARDRAWEAAKAYAAEQGVDLAKQVAAEQIPVLISRVVKGFKAK